MVWGDSPMWKWGPLTEFYEHGNVPLCSIKAERLSTSLDRGWSYWDTRMMDDCHSYVRCLSIVRYYRQLVSLHTCLSASVCCLGIPALSLTTPSKFQFTLSLSWCNQRAWVRNAFETNLVPLYLNPERVKFYEYRWCRSPVPVVVLPLKKRFVRLVRRTTHNAFLLWGLES
jgi:hypothetical protein